MEVLELIVRGNSNKDIAAALRISEATVKSHINNLLSSWSHRPHPSRDDGPATRSGPFAGSVCASQFTGPHRTSTPSSSKGWRQAPTSGHDTLPTSGRLPLRQPSCLSWTNRLRSITLCCSPELSLLRSAGSVNTVSRFASEFIRRPASRTVVRR